MNWFFFILISILSISIANIYQRKAMREEESDPLAASIFFQFFIAALTGVFAYFYGFQLPPFKEFPLNFVISSSFYAIGTLLIFKAIKEIEASELVILNVFSAVVTIIGANIFLNESLSFIQVIGVTFIIFAMVRIVWTSFICDCYCE